MRSFLSMSVAALLALGALSACGSDDGESGAGAGSTDTEVTPLPEPDPAEEAPDEEAGGDDSSQGPDDRQLVIEAIELLLAGEDPEIACSDAVTDRFVADAYGDRAGCVLARDPRSLARRVAVSDLAIEGAQATAAVQAKGGVYDGETIDVTLVRDGESWRVDELAADIPVGP